MINIAIIDKHPLYRLGLGIIIKGEFEEVVIHDYSSMATFYQSNHHEEWNLIIAREKLEFITGMNPIDQNISFLDFAKRRNINVVLLFEPYPKVITGSKLSWKTEDLFNFSSIIRYVKAGMVGYIPRSANQDDIITCVGHALQGKHFVSNEILEFILKKAEFKRDFSAISQKKLTLREFEVADYLSIGKTVNWIAHTLDLKASTVSTTKYKIFKKLNIDNVIELNGIINSIRTK